MSHYKENPKRTAVTNTMITASWWPTSRRFVLRRSKPITIRLGGSKPSKGLMLVKVFKGTKLRWLKQQYSCTFKRLKQCCSNFVKEKMVGDKSMDSFQQMLLMEATFSVPGIYFHV